MSRKLLSLFVATLVTVGLMAPALAGGGGGDPAYTISASGPERVTEGADFTASVILDNNGGDLAGWSYGVCIDPAEMTANAFGPSDSDTANCGALPGFVTNTIYVDGSGWSQAMVIDLFGLCTLNWLFKFGTEPPAPGPFNDGPDPTGDSLPECNSDDTTCT